MKSLLRPLGRGPATAYQGLRLLADLCDGGDLPGRSVTSNP